MFGLDARKSEIVAAVAGGLLLVLLAALVVTRHRLRVRTGERDRAVASLTVCKAAVAEQNAKFDALRKVGDARSRAALDALDRAGRDRDRLDATIAGLEASARAHPAEAECASSEAFRKAIGGL